MLSTSQKRMIFAWSVLSLVTLTYARAITVSNAPSFLATRNRRHQSTTNTLARSLTGESRLLIHDNDDENLDDMEALLLESCLLTSRGGAAASAIATEKAWVDGLKNSLASALAAAFSKIILAPFDTIKTLQQYHQSSSSMPSLTLLEAARVISERPGGFLNFYVRIFLVVCCAFLAYRLTPTGFLTRFLPSLHPMIGRAGSIGIGCHALCGPLLWNVFLLQKGPR